MPLHQKLLLPNKNGSKWKYLWFKIAMHNTLGMQEIYDRDEFAHNVAGFRLGKMFLTFNSIKEFASFQQFSNNVAMQLVKNTTTIEILT